jgi:Protein of unknown function (DUF1566)
MTKNLLFVCGLSLLLLISGAARAGAQTVAVGPYYAVPSWDQKLLCETPATCPRFVVLSNWNSEAVLDRETGLVWMQTPFTLKTSQDIWETLCRANAIGGRYGWRLPTVAELMTLGSPTAVGLTFHLPAGHPFSVNVADGTEFWTSDHRTGLDGFGIDFSPMLPIPGSVQGLRIIQAPSSEGFNGWCVRGIQ